MAQQPDWSWDERYAPPTRGLTIHEMFDWCVREWPDAAAVRSGTRTYTYTQLADASRHYAAELEDLGVQPGHVVPVLMPRTPEFLAVLLAIVRRGAAYVVLDPTWPHGRLQDIVNLVEAPVVVAADERAWGRPVYPPADVFPLVSAGPARTGTPVQVGPDDPCAIFFTSGTTGPAKGVVTAHRGHVRLFDDWPFAPHGTGPVMPQSLSATWDAFDLDGWATLLCGGTLIPVQDATTLMEQLDDLVARYGVDTIWVPTAVFHAMVDSRLDAFEGLRTVGTGGERLSPALARRFQQRHPGIALYNFYGPVECSVVVTMGRVRPEHCAEGAQVPLGRPLGSSGIHVLDGDRQCAAGEVGEICLSGPGLALGYLGDEQATAAKFVRVELDGVVREVYRTGDLGHLDPTGDLHFDGRLDRQVKVRGHRVEIDALERGVGLVAGVGSNVILPLLGGDGLCEDLCLFYVADQDAGLPVDGVLSEAALRRALLDRLPAFLVPAFIHRLDRLPVAQDRKVDQAALLQLARDLRAGGATGDGPVGETEELMAQMFQSLLGIAAVPRHESFFALGGNSLNAAQLSFLIEEQHGTRIKLSQIFRHSSVAGLAALLDGASHV